MDEEHQLDCPMGNTLYKYGKSLGDNTKLGSTLIKNAIVLRKLAYEKYQFENQIKNKFVDNLSNMRKFDINDIKVNLDFLIVYTICSRYVGEKKTQIVVQSKINFWLYFKYFTIDAFLGEFSLSKNANFGNSWVCILSKNSYPNLKSKSAVNEKIYVHT